MIPLTYIKMDDTSPLPTPVQKMKAKFPEYKCCHLVPVLFWCQSLRSTGQAVERLSAQTPNCNWGLAVNHDLTLPCFFYQITYWNPTKHLTYTKHTSVWWKGSKMTETIFGKKHSIWGTLSLKLKGEGLWPILQPVTLGWLRCFGFTLRELTCCPSLYNKLLMCCWESETILTVPKFTHWIRTGKQRIRLQMRHIFIYKGIYYLNWCTYCV